MFLRTGGSKPYQVTSAAPLFVLSLLSASRPPSVRNLSGDESSSMSGDGAENWTRTIPTCSGPSSGAAGGLDWHVHGWANPLCWFLKEKKKVKLLFSDELSMFYPKDWTITRASSWNLNEDRSGSRFGSDHPVRELEPKRWRPGSMVGIQELQ